MSLVLLAARLLRAETTSCKRLASGSINGLKPLQISLMITFVDRDKTPKDENGEFDFESICLNLDLLNEQFNGLLPWRGGGTAENDFPSAKSDQR